MDLNHRSPPYKGGALTTKLYAPMFRDRDSKHQFFIPTLTKLYLDFS